VLDTAAFTQRENFRRLLIERTKLLLSADSGSELDQRAA
jgi:hypothetical protein